MLTINKFVFWFIQFAKICLNILFVGDDNIYLGVWSDIVEFELQVVEGLLTHGNEYILFRYSHHATRKYPPCCAWSLKASFKKTRLVVAMDYPVLGQSSNNWSLGTLDSASLIKHNNIYIEFHGRILLLCVL